MRLLNATTLAMEEFHGADIPPYAILSHTWGKDEVLFTDIANGLFDSRQKHGFKKIEHCANQARADGLSYCWIDTCSINKSSSAELSEAINSMFTWYSKAEKCYAYLEDVSSESVLDEFDYGPLLSFNSDRARVIDRWVGAISNSRWITRGWTLQELIAPVDVFFYSQDWRPMGSKKKWSHYLAAVTGIDQNVLRYSDFRNVSVAERMSWAARRSTTRLEDEAYCLMGIFEVNMPLLYGEGEKAFTRLQEEIIKSSDDQSIFAWTAVGKSRTSFRGLLARSPLEFRDCQDIKFLRSMEGEPFSMTNRGLRISLLCSVRITDPPELLGLLNCTKDTRQLAISLACLSEPGKTDQYARVDPGHITHIRREKTAAFTHMQLLYIRNTFHSLPNFKTNRISGFSLGEFKSTFYMCSAWPDNIMLSDNMNYYFVDNPMPAFDGIHTARIMWHSNVGWQPFLFEFQFNGSSCVVRQPPGLGKLLLSDSLPPYGFQGVLCRMKPTYEISQVPMLNDVVTDGGFPAGRELQLGLVVVQDEVMIAATGALMKTLRETDHLRT